MIFAYDNKADDATITSSQDTAALPVANLQDTRVSKVCRFDNTSITIDVDFGSNISMQVFSLIAATLASTDTVRWKASTVSAGGTDVFDSGAINSNVADGYGMHIYYRSAASSIRYLQIVISAASRVSAGYVDIGRLFCGPLISMTRKPNFGYSETWLDESQITIATKSGTDYVDIGPQRRQYDFGINEMSEADATLVREMDRIAGLNGQVLFTPFETDSTKWPTQSCFGRFRQASPITWPFYGVFSKGWTMQQSL